MVSKEHPDVIDGRRRFIAVDILNSEEESEDTSIDRYGAALDEEGGSGLVGAGVTEEVGDMQKAVKSSYILSYMLKPSHLLTQVFEKNRTAQDNLFRHMCWGKFSDVAFSLQTQLQQITVQ